MKFTWSRCPHCKKTLNIEVEGGAGAVQDFGKAVYINCPKCNNLISNRIKEWTDISTMKKATEVLRMRYTAIFNGFVASIFITVILYFVLGMKTK